MAMVRFGTMALAAYALAGLAAGGAAAAEDGLGIVQERQELMGEMLGAVNRIAPRLGSGAAPVNPSHWPVIRDSLDIVGTLLGRSRDMWPARSNLGWGSVTQATPGLWRLPGAFGRHYDEAEAALPVLRDAAARESAPAARESFCRLVAACGRCHAAFRKIDYMSLYREGPHWLGRYPGCTGSE